MSKSRDIADSAATINYIDGLTSDAQSQINAKATLDGSPTFTGTVTATAFSGDGSGLTGVDSLPSQTGNAGSYLTTDGTDASWAEVSSSPTLEATASGTLANGDKVIVNSDGTVSSIVGITQTEGSDVVFESASSTSIGSTFDSNSNKVVVAYRDGPNNGYGTAVVGTISGTSISFGTPVVFEVGDARYMSLTFDSNSNKVVIFYSDNGNSNRGTAIVGTVSGTSISFGSPVIYNDAGTYYIDATFDSNVNKTVVAYLDNSIGGLKARVGTVSGTSISFGTANAFAGSSNFTSITFDSNSNKVVVAYRDGLGSEYGTARVGTVSGTSISFGSSAIFENSGTSETKSTFDSNSNKVIISYKNFANSNYGTAVVGTVSGTSISFGTPVVFNSAAVGWMSSVFDANANKVVTAYQGDGGGAGGALVVGVVSGTTISFDLPISVGASTNTFEYSCAFDSNTNQVAVSYSNAGSSEHGTSFVFRNSSSNMKAQNYIGISDATYADGVTAKIQIVGSVDDAQSGLTAGKSYYVQAIDGSLATTPDTPSVFAGTAVSATKLIVKG